MYLAIDDIFYEFIKDWLQHYLAVHNKREKNTAGGQAKSKNPKYNETLKNLFEKKDRFENLIISNSSKYTKA